MEIMFAHITPLEAPIVWLAFAAGIALGARSTTIGSMVMRRSLSLVAVGLVVGALGAFGLMRLMESLLFGVTTLDLPTLIAVPVVLVTVAIAACYLPVRRATRVNPMDALRYE